MKIIITSILVLLASFSFAQSGIPSVEIRNIDGAIVNSSEIQNDGKPIVISFWATWCKPCVKELSAISELYDEWQEETGVKVIAVSVDDSKSMTRVKPFVNAKGWEFDVYNDPNSDFKRAMNVVNVPHTFLLNGDLEIVSQHTTYAEGDEEDLFEEIQELVTE
jgi:cytochrome c biogenesis protein CcmG, thiol:disulfide interchange protein DsbE